MGALALIMTMQPSSLSDGARRARLTHLLHRAAHMRRQTFDARLRPFGITAVQYWVLGRLARTNDSGLTQTELARALESGKVSVGALVTRLEALGLVERRDDSRDRRIRRIFLTDPGYVAMQQTPSLPPPNRESANVRVGKKVVEAGST